MINDNKMSKVLFTIGYSNRSLDDFVALLKQHKITVVCDVRSAPYSRFVPQYNRNQIEKTLKTHGTDYVFLGEELGARSTDPSCYVNEKALYRKIAATKLFKSGIARVMLGIEKGHVPALMCAEKDPMVCHRAIMVCGNLRGQELDIRHIIDQVSMDTQADLEARMITHLKLQPNLLETPEEFLARAYETQGDKIAYVRENP